MSNPIDLLKRYRYLVEMDVDKKQIRAAAFIVTLLVPFLGAIPMALMQRPFEAFVFYFIAAIIMVPAWWGHAYSSLDDRRLNDLIPYVE
jgi:hypothetical protein